MRNALVTLATAGIVLASFIGSVSAGDGWEWVPVSTLQRQPFVNVSTHEISGVRLADGECGFRLSLTSTPQSPPVLGARIIATNRAVCRAVVQEGEPQYNIFGSDTAERGVIAGGQGAARGRGKGAVNSFNAPAAALSLTWQGVQEWDDNATSAMRTRTINTLRWNYDGSCVNAVDLWQVSYNNATVMTHDPGYDWGDHWSSCQRWTVEGLSSATKNTAPNFGCRDVNGYLYAYGWYNGSFTSEGYGSSGCPHYRVIFNTYS
jgi:hypothetical protein